MCSGQQLGVRLSVMQNLQVVSPHSFDFLIHTWVKLDFPKKKGCFQTFHLHLCQ